MPVIGFLSGRSPGESVSVEAAFRSGLKEIGYIEGENVHIAFRWAEGQYDRLPALAADLARQNVAVIAAFGGAPPARAAKAATATIPIVFTTGGDPVKEGLVVSLNRPSGNVTGVSFYSALLGAKRLELLHSLDPKIDRVGVLVNPNIPEARLQLEEVQNAARALGVEFRALNAGSEREIDTVFTTIAQDKIEGLVVTADPFFNSQRDRLAELSARFKVPAIYQAREHVVAGGLMSYGASITDTYRQAGVYVGQILKGEKPSDLPVLQPTTFELVINQKAAKALGLTIPDKLLATADEVIE
jgi:putative ABC transport system substrate-binding protein